MYTLTFTEDQMTIIDRALQDVPFKFAMPIVQSINEQIMKAEAEKTRIASEEAAKEKGKKT
jgi:hypothetical protein